MLYTLHDGKALFIERWILQESFMLIREIDIYTSLAETWYLLELMSMGVLGEFVAGQFVADDSSRTIRRMDNSLQDISS